MTRLARLLHLDDGEFPALRAQIEARPPRVGVRTQRPPLPLGVPARAVAALAEMHLADGSIDTLPLPLTDWQARIASDFGAVNSALQWLSINTYRRLVDVVWVEYYQWNAQHDMCADIEAELAPFTTKAEVA